MVNLLVDLDERYTEDAAAAAHAQLAAAGFDVAIRMGADDRTLAWIDDAFGGTWSSEAFTASNVITFRDGAPIGFASFDPKEKRFAWLRGEASHSGTGVFGPFGVDPKYRGALRQAQDDTTLPPSVLSERSESKGQDDRGGQDDTVATLILTLAMCELRARGYKRALIAAVGDQRLIAYYRRVADVRVVEEFDPLQSTKSRARVVILASGSGSNAQAVIDAAADGLPIDLKAIVTNRRSARVIERAERAGIHCDVVIWNRAEDSRAQYDSLLLDAVRAHKPHLVLLLGWMHVLDEAFVAAFPHLLNIHPAFLPHDLRRDEVAMPDGSTIPAFRGAHAVADALRASSAWVGASFHAVTMEPDRGAIVARKPLKVEAGEAEEHVLERLHPIEHNLVVTGIKRFLYERG